MLHSWSMFYSLPILGGLVATQRGTSLTLTLMLPSALQSAGAGDELIQAIIDDPEVAAAAVKGAQQHLDKALHEDEARHRREFMATNLIEGVFSSRVRNLLRRRRVETIGDLCMQSWSDVGRMYGTGRKTIVEITQVLAVHGLDLRGEYENPLQHAIRLYGGAEYVPSKLMPMWINSLDGRTMDILLRFETLGDLCALSGREFMEEQYGRRNSEPLSIRKNQMLKVRAGLKEAGLTLRSE